MDRFGVQDDALLWILSRALFAHQLRGFGFLCAESGL